jgi:hypothetical protein
MPWSRRKKLIAWCSGVVAVGLAFEAGRSFNTAWHRFQVEDNITFSYRPIVHALEDYERDHGAIATNITQLVPRYLQALPSSRYAESIEYRALANGPLWEIRVFSRSTKPPRLYVYRAKGEFSAEEREKMHDMVHGWAIFMK